MLEQSKRFPMIMDYLRSHDARVIQVVRENVLKTLISRAVKKKTGVSHSSKGVKKTTVQLRTDRLKRDLEKLDAENAAWERDCAGMQFIRVNYEHFVANKQAELARLLGFLEIEGVPELETGRVKLTSDDLREVIENYDAVDKALRGTKYEWCLGR
jgi:LPS sulfotransferase NodH